MAQVSLTGLRAFVMVGKTGSVRRAAEAMNVDHASVSRHIRQLEARLGVSLFHHQGRRIVLSEAGARYLRKTALAFDLIEDATREIAAGSRRDLELHATPGFAHRILLPNMPSLQELLPGWTITLLTSETTPTQNSGAIRIEIAFRDGPGSEPGRICELMAQPRLFPAVSPRLRPEWLSVRTVEELCALPVITADADGLWGVWLRRAGADPAMQVRGPNMPNTHIMMEAAAFGQGVALVNEVIARKAIADGEIAEILDTDIRFHGYYISGPARGWDETPVADVRRWMHALIAA